MSVNNSSESALIKETNKIMSKGGKKKTPKLVIIIAILVILSLLPFGAQYVANKYVSSEVSALFASLSGKCSFTFGSAKYNILKRNLSIFDISVSCDDQNVALLEQIEVKGIVKGAPIPSNAVADIKGGELNPNAKVFGSFGMLASELGYQTVPFTAKFAYTIGSVSKEFKISTFSFTSDGFGVIDAEVKVPNINSKTISGFIDEVWNNKPAEIWVSFKNGGLLQRFIDYYASVKNVEPDKAKANIYKWFESRITSKAQSNVDERDRFIQVYRFIQNQKELIIKVDPKSELSISDVFSGVDYSSLKTLKDSFNNFKPEIYSH